MKGRSFGTFGCFILSGWLLAGCAGNQTLSDGSGSFDFGNRPQVVIAGATHADLKGLAMGAARSKGWTIVKSTDDLLIMQRPLDPAGPSAGALGATNSGVPPVIEVTAAFRDQSGGVSVALAATLITEPPGERGSKRADYTENYREALTQSLESLRSNWTANRQRVANAIPPQSPGTEPSPPGAAPRPERTSPPTQAWGTSTEQSEPPAGTRSAPEREVPPPTPEPLIPTPAPENDQPAAIMPPLSDAKPTRAPQPPASGPSPAPVIDGSSAVGGRPPAQLAQPETEPTAPQNSMLTLSQTGGTGIWAYNAEQFARLHGCAVADGGTQLIEGRADGEVHKVSCVGSDSYLLKCQNGVCRELAAVEHKPTSPEPKPAPEHQGQTGSPGSPVGKPGAKTAKADLKAASPEPRTGKADSKVAKPEAKNAKADSKQVNTEAKTAKADPKATKPESKVAKADPKATKPEPKIAKADPKATKPATQSPKADSKTSTPEVKTAKTEPKRAKP